MSEAFRISLAGSVNSRVVTPTSLSLHTSVVGVAIVGLAIVGESGVTNNKDQRFVNCFTETVTNPFTGQKTRYLVKRPGFAASGLTPQAGSIGNEILIWTGASSKIISAFGATHSSIYDSATQLATNNADTTKITGLARSITETDLSGTATITIASTDSTAWYYQTAGTVTKIADADFPGNAGFTTVGGIAHMDGFAFIMDTRGRIWNSDVNSVTAWTSTSFISANSYPDAGRGVIRLGTYIVAFGSDSVQFFRNAGNISGSPLERVEPMTLKIGCISSDAITEVTGTIFWAGSGPQGGIAIYTHNGSTAQRISVPEVESALLLAGTSNISLAATKFYGRSFVLVQASTLTYAYCIEEQAWHEWASTTPLWYKSAGVSSGTQVTYAISKSSTSGKIYIINPAALTFQDDGVAFFAIAQLARIGEPYQLTTWDEINIDGDTEPISSIVSISASDNDYVSSSVLGTIDLNVVPRLPLRRMGSAFQRSWILTNSTNSPMRIKDLVGRKTMGT